jgi:hypothetical protein
MTKVLSYNEMWRKEVSGDKGDEIKNNQIKELK